MRGATAKLGMPSVTISFISIHAPHARSDRWPRRLSLRTTHFNPRSSCEERLLPVRCAYANQQISIHAPHARSDSNSRPYPGSFSKFQSTLLMRGATSAFAASLSAFSNFNPRSSCEERLRFSRGQKTGRKFQSTLLMRGATNLLDKIRRYLVFQSTLLMRGAASPPSAPALAGSFQSTLLMRGATSARAERILHRQGSFQSTLLMRGATSTAQAA